MILAFAFIPLQVGSEGQIICAKEATVSMSKTRVKRLVVKGVGGRKPPIFGKFKIDKK